MDIEVIEKAYRRYAQGYDLYFGAVLQPGRRAVVRRMAPRPGERILEVGAGTGLSLPLYPRDTQVTGIDVSTDMLTRARHAGRATTSRTSWRCGAWTASAWNFPATASTRRWRCTSSQSRPTRRGW